MADIIETFFEQLATQRYLPRLRTMSGICRWNIEGVGGWTLSLKEGDFTVTKGSTTIQADCTITCRKDDFVRIAQGQQNPLTAFLQGRLSVTGNLAVAQICMRMFRTRLGNVHQQTIGA